MLSTSGDSNRQSDRLASSLTTNQRCGQILATAQRHETVGLGLSLSRPLKRECMEAAKVRPDSQVKTVKRFAAFVRVILIQQVIQFMLIKG